MNSYRCKSDGKCISARLFCDFKNDCVDGSDEARCPSTCDFESNTCGWQNTKIGDRMDWVRHQGLTPSNGTGPPVDHTTNSSKGRLSFTPTVFLVVLGICCEGLLRILLIYMTIKERQDVFVCVSYSCNI